MSKTGKKGWGERLKRARQDMPQELFLLKLGSGWNRRSLGNYENEKTAIDIERLIKIKEVTGFSLDWIATGEGTPLPARAIPEPIIATLIAELADAIENFPNTDKRTKSELIVRYLFSRLEFLTEQKGSEQADSEIKLGRHYG